MRSLLSILGVMIGVAAVIAMLALGAGAKKSMEQTLASLGTNLLMVNISQRAGGIALGAEGAVTRLDFSDQGVLERIDHVAKVVPYVTGRAQAVFQNRNWNTSINGTTPDYLSLRQTRPAAGRFFLPAEANGRAKVAVIGQVVARELFGEDNPVGNSIRVNRVSFTVIGVMARQGAAGWRNLDDQIFVPVKTAMYRLLGRDYINYFEVRVDDVGNMSRVSEEIVERLAKSRRLLQAEKQNINVVNMAEIQQAAGELTRTLSYLLGAIAAVSLLVGGIGIMNIMLVTVVERTREIGLRKALGARKSDIMTQFLVESVLICLFGGVIGIIFGSGISWLLSTFAQWTIFISLNSILLAFIFSIGVGVVFGLWPAWRAAGLLPIEALRYE